MINFRDYLNNIDKLSDQEWLDIKEIQELRQLKKEEQLLGVGEKDNFEIFVEHGIIRGYIIDNEGNEKSTSFFQEGEFMGINAFRTKDGRSLSSYQALCDTQVLLINSDKLRKVFSGTRRLSEIGRIVKEREINRINRRDNCLMQVKAIDKYMNFILHYPQIESVISQRFIASYLGITPVSLSRIKKSLTVSKTVNN